MTKEKFFDDWATYSQPLTAIDKTHLSQFIQSPHGRKALANLLCLNLDVAGQLISSTFDSLTEVSRLQGRVEGIRHAVERLFDLAQSEEEETEDAA